MDKTITYHDITGFYTDEGKGAPVLLLHGFCEDGSVWNGFRKALSKTFRVLVPDLPGYGNSQGTKEELSMEWMADFVKAILDKEKISSLTVIGHSMGGYITLALAEKFPGLPEKIGLFHSHCFADDEEKKKARQKGIDFIAKNGTDDYVNELYNNLFGEKFFSEKKSIVDTLKSRAKSYPAETILAGLDAMKNRPDRSAVLKSFKKPVLFLLGRQDKVLPYGKSVEQCQYPAISEVHLLEGTGHMGMFEEPKKTLHIVEEFLNLKATA